MKHILTLDSYLNEGFSKINPGMNMIKAGIAGASSAASYLQKAQAVMELYDKLNQELLKARKEKAKETIKEIQQKKKDALSKLLELKKEVSSKYPEEMEKIPAEKKEAARQKAPDVLKTFTDKVKKREKKEDKIEADLAKEDDKEEKGDVNPEEIKQQMEVIQKKIQGINDELQTEEGLKKYAPNIYKAIMNDEDIDEEEAASIVNKLIQPLTDQYNKLKDQLDKVKGKDESYVWECIDLILEFDADAAVDKAESAIKAGIADAKGGDDGDNKDSDDSDVSKYEKDLEKLKEKLEDAKNAKKELKDEWDDYQDNYDDDDGPIRDDYMYKDLKSKVNKAQDEVDSIEMEIRSLKDQIADMKNESTNYKHISSFSQFLRENQLS
jgi:chromosome segregation ATPase